MQSNAKWCKLVHVNASKSMQCKRDHYWWHEADERQCQRGRHLPRPDSTSDYLSILCPSLAWWYYMVLCRGLNVSLSFNIQSAVSCPPILWQAKVAITCSLPIDHQCQTKLMDYTLLDQAGQAALQFCQPEDVLSFIANATAGTFNQRGMCAHIYYSCLQSAALECKLSIILKV